MISGSVKKFNDVQVGERQVDLSDLEYKILLLMMEHPAKVFSAQNLYESYGRSRISIPPNSTVMVHIRKTES